MRILCLKPLKKLVDLKKIKKKLKKIEIGLSYVKTVVYLPTLLADGISAKYKIEIIR